MLLRLLLIDVEREVNVGRLDRVTSLGRRKPVELITTTNESVCEVVEVVVAAGGIAFTVVKASRRQTLVVVVVRSGKPSSRV